LSTTLLEAARELALVTGAVALSFFDRLRAGKGLDVSAKGDGTPVSEADHAAERAARAWVAERFPDDGVLGEELGASRLDARRTWVIDPIDGTKTFVRGVPLWGSLVALVEGSVRPLGATEARLGGRDAPRPVVLAGAAAFPATGEVLAAAPGQGCHGARGLVRVSSVARLEEATVLTTDERFLGMDERGARYRALASGAQVARSWGDCYGYLLVATGRAEVMVDPVLSPWDAACFLPIIEEAGGAFFDWRGERDPFGDGAIATNAALAGLATRELVTRSASP
jgi:histidinol-phosphatase